MWELRGVGADRREIRAQAERFFLLEDRRLLLQVDEGDVGGGILWGKDDL